MNRKIYLSAFTVAVILMLGLNACKKEEAVTYTGSDSNPEVAAMAKEADDEYRSDAYDGGDESNGFSVVNSGMPEEYTLNASDMDEDGGKRHSPKRHTNCLRKLNLSDSQKTAIVAALIQYDSCKFADIEAHLDSLKSLILKTELSRRGLILDFQTGQITKADFQLGMKALRLDFKLGLMTIKMAHADHLRECYKAYLQALQGILSTNQWQAFARCNKK